MKLFLVATVLTTVMLTACSANEQEKKTLNPQSYQVADRAALQQRFEQLNQKLASDFAQLKKVESLAFSDQSALDVNNLKSLNQHFVASTALKPSKVAYCDVMNGYFAEMYHLGHFNLDKVNAVKLPNAGNEDLSQVFANSDQFYDFIINRYTTYKQAQETMQYGCNLKAALK
ncbi:hypothetical protein B9T33_04585 [Acinetobacter sp. ANC 5054]|uniref:hypothetical protein n=1 Tax=Acinetobacter sp. ANC 5054 TaxID=1977877 RepID=UPI000A35196F|nr:hypothetical protein [Acinetobacter sp. ANC 5054]OTG82732.1 hypothetical protein B9T33_04585 [Acinetobacter sp. ANC 5054]